MSWNRWIRTVEIVAAVSRSQPVLLAGQADALLRTGCRIFHVRVGADLGALSTVRLLAPLAKRYDGVISIQIDGDPSPGALAAVAEAGASSVTVQYEAVADARATLGWAREHGLAAGLAVAEGTDFEAVSALAPDLVRSPGAHQYEQLKNVRLLSRALVPGTPIQVGGGLSHENVKELYQAGARLLVVGAAIFDREDLPRAYRRLVQALA
ncbi:MAG TPA: hypothetical protein VG265_13665 [Gaiellaceae bacterium]|jgi:thiamine monophosphate synthase|nr:hypothetical protein [Gaiellaceae bacterium]